MVLRILWVALALCCTTGCRGSVLVEPGEGDGVAAEPQGELPNFSWVVPDQLAGMGRPGRSNPLDEDLAALHELGIALLVSLTESPIPAEAAAPHGIEVLHIPVPDMTAPSMEQLHQFTSSAFESVGTRPLTVHCEAGMGRTGTFLAAWFVAQGMGADDAIAEIRRLRPGSIETADQEQAVRDFEAYLAEIKAEAKP
jgi:atypical dual specificity phosphatase